MAFNTKSSQPPRSNNDPIQSATQPTLRGPKGAPAFQRTPQSELYLLATTGFFGQDKFYESARDSNSRFVELVRVVAEIDWTWLLDFTTWLRNDANIRAAAIVAGLEGAKRMLELHGDTNVLRGTGAKKGAARQLAQAGISRADEVGEAAAYWASKYGRNFPKPIKHALGDCLTRLNEYGALKYNSDNSAFKLAHLINLFHPKGTSPAQNDLFAWIIASQKGPTPAPASLPMIQNRQFLMALKPEIRRAALDPVALKAAGMTWESMAGWLQGPLDARAWEAVAPSMGYMALLRNLRNFDQAGIKPETQALIRARLSSPVEVLKSRQLPMRFFSAIRAVESYNWHSPLSAALDTSLSMVPTLPGRTLILVDTSGSMDSVMSEHGTLKRWDVAAMFGVALGKTSPGAEVHSYSSTGFSSLLTKQFIPAKGADTLSQLVRWVNEGYNIGGGTPTAQAMAKLFNGQDRVILLTDEGHDYGQLSVTKAVPADVPVYTFNLAGYKAAGMASTPNRYTFGGLNDQAFKLVKLIEDGTSGNWPWVSTKEGTAGE